MRRWSLEPAGLVLADKQSGPSSFALVRELRNRTGARAGHAGTLDPFATGLLLVLLGAATRLAQYLVGLDKRYETAIDLRGRTSTGDREGEMVEEREPPAAAELEATLARLRGDVTLRVPAASAVKIDGERAYKLARRGVEVEMPVRTTTVHELVLEGYRDGVATLSLHVSSGTYVRAIADALGGHCVDLRRTAVGAFRVEDADLEAVLPPAAALPHLDAVGLTEEQAAAVRSGRAVPGEAEGLVRLEHDGRLVAVARGADGSLHPETVLP